jgi:hypothetical protein
MIPVIQGKLPLKGATLTATAAAAAEVIYYETAAD